MPKEKLRARMARAIGGSALQAAEEQSAADARAAADASVRQWRELAEWLGLDAGMERDAMAEATYYACLKVLREAIGRMPLKLMRQNRAGGFERAVEHPLYYTLLRRPNRYMSATDFWSSVEQCRNHYGNAFVLCRGYGTRADPVELWLMPNDEVDVWYDKTLRIDQTPDIYYRWCHGGNVLVAKSGEVLHFRSSDTFNGIMGVPVIERLGGLVLGAGRAQEFQNKLIANGMTGKSVLQYSGELSPDSAKTFAKHISDYVAGDFDEAGAKDVIPIPVGTSLTPLNTKLTDAQFAELRKYSAIQIASAFGIKPQQIGDMTKTSYASSQAQQEAFYTDTLLYIVKGYEEEITAKLLTRAEQAAGLAVEFDTSTTLKSSFEATVKTYCEGIDHGIFAPADGQEALRLPRRPEAERLMVNGAMIPLDMLGAQYAAQDGASSGGGERE